MRSLLSPELIAYSEAVTNPFGNGAIGAILPDQYQELTIPALDRLEFDLDYTSFNSGSFDWTDPGYATGHNAELIGCMVWFQPRCAESGYLSLNSENLNNYSAIITESPRFPYAIGTSGFQATAAERAPATDMYVMCYTGVWYLETEGFSGNATGLYFERYKDGGTIVVPDVTGYKILPFPRIENIAENLSKARILGAGLKLWSEEAPINTGGYVIGGWASYDDILPMIQNTSTGSASADADTKRATDLAQSNEYLTAVTTNIKGAQRSTGVDGVTVRYSPLQTQDQIESEILIVNDDMYDTLDSDWTLPTAFTDNPADPYVNLIAQPNADLTAFDVITRGSYIPVVYWKWNTGSSASGGPDYDVTSLYTLRVMSTVHLDGQPRGDCPFMSQHLEMDVCSPHVKTLLENWSVYPPAVTGHTFKSFISKAGHVIGKIEKGAGHIYKILSLVDKYVGKYSKGAAVE